MRFKTRMWTKDYEGFEPVDQATEVDPLAIFVAVWLDGDFHCHFNVDGDEGLKNLLTAYKDNENATVENGSLFYRAFHPI